MFHEYVQHGGNDENVLDYFSRMEKNIRDTLNEKPMERKNRGGNILYQYYNMIKTFESWSIATYNIFVLIFCY